MARSDTDIFEWIWVGPKAPLRIPKEFDRLYDLAYNLWWTWDPVAYEIWGRIDPRLWGRNRNPISLLQVVEPATWDALASNASFAEMYAEVVDRFDTYMDTGDTWFQERYSGVLDGPVAYLCTEYGIDAKLPIYSGGLGVLAGDHVKAASDLGIPLVAVGLLYRRGYFNQAVDPDGWQQHTYQRLELSRRPIREVLDSRTGRPMRVTVPVQGRDVTVGAWRLDVGRVPLLLLDTDLPENDPADRPITHILYVRGREMRFCQETVLGIGGARMLEALRVDPSMWHVNEGHAALSLLQRLSWQLNTGASFADAEASVAGRTLFTLHTPVPAGNEVFDISIATGYLGDSVPGIDAQHLESLSRAHAEAGAQFDMGALAIRLSDRVNGVSKRHAAVASQDWGHLTGGEVLAITNGVHPQTWVGRNMERLFRKAVGTDWVARLTESEAWEAIYGLSDDDVWRAHEAQKELMLRRLRGRLREEYARHGSSPQRLRWIDDQLPSNRLTIVFARRFATYKRAGLIFSDPGRIHNILTNPERPVQIVFAGKAHPADRDGQGLVRWVVEMSNSSGLEGHVFFIENQDMALSSTLVSGADVWLNTPRPPNEASGTSGMKAAMNGGLNLSVLDGWWVEGYNEKNGWGFGEHFAADAEDAGYLYHLLESQVVPRFYDRDHANIPHEWASMMKESIVVAMTGFTSQRMAVDYTRKAYVPLGRKRNESVSPTP